MGFGDEACLIRCGTCRNSDFGWRYFGNGGRPMNPTVVLWRTAAKCGCSATHRTPWSSPGLRGRFSLP